MISSQVTLHDKVAEVYRKIQLDVSNTLLFQIGRVTDFAISRGSINLDSDSGATMESTKLRNRILKSYSLGMTDAQVLK